MSSREIENLMEQGKRALRNGNKPEAQSFFMKVTEQDEGNAEAWLWLSSAVGTRDEQIICLENVLVLSPENTQAQHRLNQLRQSTSFEAVSFDEAPASGSSSVPSDDYDAFANAIFNDAPFGADDSFDAASPPTTTSMTQADMRSSLLDPDPEPAPSSPPPAEPDYNDELNALLEVDPEPASMSASDDLMGGVEDNYYSDLGDLDGEADNYADDDFEQEDPLAYLPDDIQPTRIPGTNEKLNTALVAGIGVVGVLNLVALIILILQFVL